LHTDSYFGKRRRTRTCHFKLRATIKHHFHRRSAGHLRKLRCNKRPAIRTELRTESAANVLLMHMDVRSRNAQRLRHLTSDAGDVLRRNLRVDVIGLRVPSHYRAMGFETAMSNDRSAVIAFAHGVGFLEGSVRIPVRLL